MRLAWHYWEQLTTTLAAQNRALGRGAVRAEAFVPLVAQLITPGLLVQLKSGEVAVVARRAKAGTATVSATLSNPRGEPGVGTQFRDSADARFAITGALLDPARFQRILPERVCGMLLASP